MRALAKEIDLSRLRFEEDPRWQRVLSRDRSAADAFFYSVETTGVYCRPGCAARLPHPKHVRFHRSAADAEAAGFRPCRRCKPDAPALSTQHAVLVEQACRTIENAEQPPSLTVLAHAAGLSAFHFHRVFRAATGLTPMAYAKACRARRVRAALPQSASVTQAIYGAGFNSSGRFYKESTQMLGMRPSDYRAGGAHAEIAFATSVCSLGVALVASTANGICAILIGDDPEALIRELQSRFPRAALSRGSTELEERVAAVVAFVDAPALGLDLPLDVRGTAFQHRVWRALREIPPGETASYTEIAQRIGAPAAVRAVASACAANAIAVAIPCHRVVRTDGALSGYRWGVERKRALLDKEKAAPAKPGGA